MSQAFSSQVSFIFDCERTTPTEVLNSSMPVNEEISLPYTYSEETQLFEVDYSLYNQYIESDPLIAPNCINGSSRRLIRSLQAICEERYSEEVQEEQLEQCYENTYGQADIVNERFPYQQRYLNTIIEGEHYHGDNFSAVANDVAEYCGGANFNNIALTRNFIAQELPGVLNRVDQECRLEIISNYEDRLSYLINRSSKDNSDNPLAAREAAGAQAALDTLYRVIAENGNTFDINLSHLACNPEQETSIEDLSSMVHLITEQFNCAPHVSGQNFSRNVNLSAHASPSGIEHRYRLNYENGQYNIQVNLSFSASQEVEPDPERFQEITRNCLANLNDIRGPNNEVMRITLYDGPAYADDAPPLKMISLSERGVRSNSSTWSVDTENNCGTITHEILHILGLCDEYPESSMGYVVDPETGEHEYVSQGAELTSFDCRAVGAEDSIMRNSQRGYSLNRNGGGLVQAYLCNPGLSDAECRTTATYQIISADEAAFLSTEVGKYLEDHRVLVEELDNEGANLLSPAHFSTIIYPECEERNSTYYQCAQAAYMTSSAVTGVGDDTCPDLPEECANGNTAWVE